MGSQKYMYESSGKLLRRLNYLTKRWRVVSRLDLLCTGARWRTLVSRRELINNSSDGRFRSGILTMYSSDSFGSGPTKEASTCGEFFLWQQLLS